MNVYRIHSSTNFKAGIRATSGGYIDYSHKEVSDDARFIEKRHFCGMFEEHVKGIVKPLKLGGLLRDVKNGFVSMSLLETDEYYVMCDQVFFELSKVKSFKPLTIEEIKDVFKRV